MPRMSISRRTPPGRVHPVVLADVGLLLHLESPVVVYPLHVFLASLHHVAVRVPRAVDLLARELGDHHRVVVQHLQVDQLHLGGVEQRRIRHQALFFLVLNDARQPLHHLGAAVLPDHPLVAGEVRADDNRHVLLQPAQEGHHVEPRMPLLNQL